MPARPVRELGSIGWIDPPASHCPRRRRSRFGTVSSSLRRAAAARRHVWILFVQSEPMPLLWALLVANMKSPSCRPALLALQHALPPVSPQRWRPFGPNKAPGKIIGSITTHEESQGYEEGYFPSGHRHGARGCAVGLVGLRAEKIRYRRDRYRDQDRPDQSVLGTGLRLCHHRQDPGRLYEDDQRSGRRERPQDQPDPV